MTSAHVIRFGQAGHRRQAIGRQTCVMWLYAAALATGCSVYYPPQSDPSDASTPDVDPSVAATGAGGVPTSGGAAGAAGDGVGTSGAGGAAGDAASSSATSGAAGSTSVGSGGGEAGAAGATAAGSGGAPPDDGGAGAGGGAGDMGGAAGGLPIDAGVLTVDDNVIGAGLYHFNYAGAWNHCKPCTSPSDPPLYDDSNSWIAAADANGANSVTFAFNGMSIDLYGVVDPRHGMAAMSIDGGTETVVDFYRSVRQGNQLLWASPILSLGHHVFKLRLTGTKNETSAAAGLAVDRVDVR